MEQLAVPLSIRLTSPYFVLGVRVALAVLTRTYFQPDEYFQALEPAHYAVFGYGHLTWEWLTPRPIRSIIYPAVYIPLYWFLKVTALDRFDVLMIFLPKLLTGVLSAGTDIGIAKLARVVLGNDYVATAVFLSLTSFFNALSLSRSLSNSLETSLCSLAFAYYPWDANPGISPHIIYNRSNLRKVLVFSALACVVRPTNAVIWVFLYAKLLWALHKYWTLVFALVTDAAVTALSAFAFIFVCDSLYYGKATFTPYNFLITNLSSISSFYGTSPWHYYLSQGLPMLGTTALPFAFLGIYHTWKSKDTPRRSFALENMLYTIMWSVGIYSLAGHKEWRFLHPLLPLLHIFAAKSLVDLHDLSSKPATPSSKKLVSTSTAPVAKPRQRHSKKGLHCWNDLPIRKSHVYFLLAALPASLVGFLVYPSEPISVLSYIRSLPLDGEKIFTHTIGFLTPCHSTPGHAYIHREALSVPGRIWSLGCEPPLDGQHLSAYQDQTDVFFSSPKEYLKEHFPSNVNPDFPASPFPASLPGQSGVQQWHHEWPKHIILYGDLLKEELGVKELLEEKGFNEVKRYGIWGPGTKNGGLRVWRWEG
ncbi:hypothetical protein FA15DRAFT_197688 [Coprinopsis marcescibilis]|uniref:Mannosyltransferase n=1 Tax=Coprinopsis marcescibilis TaxID=230819 RepID=A0A5C3LBH0_COPMA|nr:hypothetical protein FA15DRAFT_197688 [Coprinopsis marcescibilis]